MRKLFIVLVFSFLFLGLCVSTSSAQLYNEIEEITDVEEMEEEAVIPQRRDTINMLLTDWFQTLGKSKEEKAAILDENKAKRDFEWLQKQQMTNNSTAMEQLTDQVFTVGKPREEKVRILTERNAIRGKQRGAPEQDSMDFISDDETKKADLQKYQDNLKAKTAAKRRLEESRRGWDNEMREMDRNKRQIQQNMP